MGSPWFPQEIWTNRSQPWVNLESVWSPHNVAFQKGTPPPYVCVYFGFGKLNSTRLKTNSSPLEDGGFQVRNLQNSRGAPFSGAIAVSFREGIVICPQILTCCWLCGWKSWDPLDQIWRFLGFTGVTYCWWKKSGDHHLGMYKALNIKDVYIRRFTILTGKRRISEPSTVSHLQTREMSKKLHIFGKG